MAGRRGRTLLALLAWTLCAPRAAAEACQGGRCDTGRDVDLLVRSALAESSAMCIGGGCAAGSSAARIHSLLLRAEAALDAEPATGLAEGGESANYEASQGEEAAPADARRQSACSSLQGEIERLKSRIQDADSWNRLTHEVESEEARQVRTPRTSALRRPPRAVSLCSARLHALRFIAAAEGRRRRGRRGKRAEGGGRPVPARRRSARRRPPRRRPRAEPMPVCCASAPVRGTGEPHGAPASLITALSFSSVFSLSAPDVTSRLTVYCDGRFERDGFEGDAQ